MINIQTKEVTDMLKVDGGAGYYYSKNLELVPDQNGGLLLFTYEYENGTGYFVTKRPLECLYKHQMVGKSRRAKKEFKEMLDASSQLIKNKQLMIDNKSREKADNSVLITRIKNEIKLTRKLSLMPGKKTVSQFAYTYAIIYCN